MKRLQINRYLMTKIRDNWQNVMKKWEYCSLTDNGLLHSSLSFPNTNSEKHYICYFLIAIAVCVYHLHE